ncbi:MAG: hypothetical protein ABEJ89_09140 [Haloarculaceae archaeon]
MLEHLVGPHVDRRRVDRDGGVGVLGSHRRGAGRETRREVNGARAARLVGVTGQELQVLDRPLDPVGPPTDGLDGFLAVVARQRVGAGPDDRHGVEHLVADDVVEQREAVGLVAQPFALAVRPGGVHARQGPADGPADREVREVDVRLPGRDHPAAGRLADQCQQDEYPHRGGTEQTPARGRPGGRATERPERQRDAEHRQRQAREQRYDPAQQERHRPLRRRQRHGEPREQEADGRDHDPAGRDPPDERPSLPIHRPPGCSGVDK